MVPAILAFLAYTTVFHFAEKYERSITLFFIGSALLTPLLTGPYLAFVIHNKKKQGFVAKTSKVSATSYVLGAVISLIALILQTS